MTAARLIAPLTLGVAAVAASVAPSLAASDIPTRPLGAVRSLHHIQDQIAGGDPSAFQVQPSTLRIIDGIFAAIDTGSFSEPDQRRAVLAYAVSGGNPATFAMLYDALAPHLDGETEKVIADAVAAALIGRRVSDDPRASPLAIGGMLGAGLALLNGINAEEAAAQTAYLRQALLLAPGTLVEESALRRLMPLHTAAGEHGAFLVAASRYARTFIDSPYASDFATSLVAGGEMLTQPNHHERLAEIISFMPAAHRRSIVARQMRAATVAGNFELVRFLEARFSDEIEARQAAIAGTDVSPPDPADTLRQRLYALMANIASADHHEVAAELDAIDAGALPPADRQLLEVARAVVREMTRPGDRRAEEATPDAPEAGAVEAAGVPPAQDDDDFDLPMQPDEDQVRTVLPGYGTTAEPVLPARAAASVADSEPQTPPAVPARAGEADSVDAVPAEHRDFMSSARDMLRDVETVLEEKGQ
ncbi:MAG: hypothetical protein RIB53_10580 [Roseitalea porphyridii]|jgi:chemotaxis protein MotC|uniref:hypothetical protein n=1 Tax=Roseitalea porphyridii TaxID=1852022 RepID=UPI0032EDA8F3